MKAYISFLQKPLKRANISATLVATSTLVQCPFQSAPLRVTPKLLVFSTVESHDATSPVDNSGGNVCGEPSMCACVVQNTEDNSQQCPNGGLVCGGDVEFTSIADMVDRVSVEPETIAGSVDNDNQISQPIYFDDDISDSQLIHSWGNFVSVGHCCSYNYRCWS
ncbi:hypothetical protein V6N13_033449 [Hibiscus sabdariffa]